MKQSQFYLKAGSVKKEIEKYSDRYQAVKLSEMDNQLGWEIDWNYFPEELRIEKPKKKKKKWQTGSKYSPTVTTRKRTSRKRTAQGEESRENDLCAPAAKRKKRVSFADDSGGEEVGIDTEKKLNELERLESSSSGGVGDGAASEEEELMTEDENYDEEVEEEGTDYNLTYFDNGEDYLAGEEDALEDNEGPYY